MCSKNKKYKELNALKKQINETRNILNAMLLANPDPLDKDILALSRKLDIYIHKYTLLEAELKEY